MDNEARLLVSDQHSIQSDYSDLKSCSRKTSSIKGSNEKERRDRFGTIIKCESKVHKITFN